MATKYELDLGQADRHIAEGEARVARQRALLGVLLGVLAGMRAHRAMILAAVEAGADAPP